MEVEGIPDGWELVRVGKPTLEEFIIGHDGSPVACVSLKRPLRQFRYAVIRKIEKPKQFRPFANEKEAEPFWDVKLRYKESVKFKEPGKAIKEPGKAMFRVNCIGEVDVGIAFSVYSYQTAFDVFECIDGTPFGVEVTE